MLTAVVIVLLVIVLIIVSMLLFHGILTSSNIKEQARLLEDNAKVMNNLNSTLIKGFALNDERDGKYVDKLNNIALEFREIEASISNIGVDFGKALSMIDKSLDLMVKRLERLERNGHNE